MNAAEPVSWDVFARSTGWLFEGFPSDILVSVRVRVARNLHQLPFPHQMDPRQAESAIAAVGRALADLHFGSMFYLRVDRLGEIEKTFLVERHLISHEFAEGDFPRAVAVFPKKRISLMVNEEDHLRISVFSPRLEPVRLWRRVSALDTRLDGALRFAFSEQLGYLTACPTNLGTGFRVSALLHLPALDRSRRFAVILDLLEDLGIVIRGFFGEGSEPAGSMFQISTGKTLGKTELRIMEELESVVKFLVKEERAERLRLRKEEDLAGILRKAVEKIRRKKRISSAETFDFLSLLALVRDLDVVRVDERMIRRLSFRLFPGHLQMERGKPLPPAERDAARAELVRKELTELCLNGSPNA